MAAEGKCPFASKLTATAANQRWWPNQLNLRILDKKAECCDPMGEEFDYAKEFLTLDLDAVKKDLNELMTASNKLWPADYGHYGPFFIRMAWHSAGTYRIGDGRGGAGSGTLRFAPLNSWPDNVNLDKARRLLWPIKAKYGRKISWADLMILTGNVALESMGFQTFGFAGGRADTWEPEEDINWGPEEKWLDDQRYSGDRELAGDLGAVQMGLIYVNPEGPNGNPDPLASGRDIRETFRRMAMNDEETVALIAGGHTFGKAHGAANPGPHVGVEPEGAPIEAQGVGWKNSHGCGCAGDTISSGLEGAWTVDPIKWDNGFFDNLFGYEWVQTKSPAGATQWIPKEESGQGLVPDAHNPEKKHAPVMFTSDLALKFDPAYAPISKRFHENPKDFADAFARAWYKLTHRDMGYHANFLGKEVPAEQIWEDPVPKRDHEVLGDEDVAKLKAAILASGVSVSAAVSTAWASASTYRKTDLRGGANGARIRLAPQNGWESNKGSADVLAAYEKVQKEFGKPVSIADIIVVGGAAGIEKALENAGHKATVAVKLGRTDASDEQTDAESFAVLEPRSDGFRNFYGARARGPAAENLVDRAFNLGLSKVQMTVLVGGLRVLGTNADGSKNGVFTTKTDTLSRDFFVNLLDWSTEWNKVGDNLYEGKDRASGEVRWTATEADLVFGSNSILRAIAEVYASDDAEGKFGGDFIAAWNKVMNNGYIE